MKEQLMRLIDNEDKKNPLTDEQIAKELSVSRYEVIKLRKKLNIQDYSKRRLPYLKKVIEEIIREDSDISNTELTKVVQESGFNISRFLVTKLKEETIQMVSPKNILTEEVKENLINDIIGSDGSIKFQVDKAKAAVLYPPYGLHTLILGQTGTGKSHLAERMYMIALNAGRIKENTEFIKLNCADYSNNPQLLLSQLFGYVKGAFTGADYDKEGMIAKANGGILFLDEIHRLPLEGQEILFSVIDKGKYRKLGQTEGEESVNVMIVGATTEDINSHLLSAFKRRIPMCIDLPPLSSRPIDERYQMVIKFLKNEVDRMNIKLYIRSEALCALLLYRCVGNTGQLRSDIQVACARAYLRYLNENNDNIILDIADFNSYVQQGLLRNKYKSDDIKKYLNQGIVAIPQQNEVGFFDEDDLYVLPDMIYKFIDERFEILKKQSIPQKLVYNLVGRELEIKLERTIRHISKKSKDGFEKENIKKIVGEDLVEVVEKMIHLAETRLGPLDISLVYCISLHLHESIQRIQNNKKMKNHQLERLKNTYILEYQTAQEMLELAENILGVKFPEDEAGFITLYLKTKRNCFEKNENRVRIIIITHGNVAIEMAKIANSLLGNDFVEAICMPLNEEPELALNRTVDLVKKINEDEGILLLVDMGSLLTFGELVTKITGIPTRTVGRVDTAMVLEASLRAKNGDISLYELYEMIERQNIYMGCLQRDYKKENEKVIVTLCITGNGAAIKLKKLIEDMMPTVLKNQVEIIPVGMLNDNVSEYIKNLQQSKDLLAVIGTINPNIDGVKFLPTEAIIDGDGMYELQNMFDKSKKKIMIKKAEIKPMIREELILQQANFQTKDEVIDTLAAMLENNGHVKESFLINLYKRELQTPTIFANGIAIPHTYPKYIIKPAVAIATLKKPVKWAENYYADIIFMLALDYNNDSVLRYLYIIGNNKEFLNKLRECRKRDEISSLLFTTPTLKI